MIPVPLSHSQAAQDRFVSALLDRPTGTFLEIGCSHPTELSNTYALEQLGWRGLMFDNDANAVRQCNSMRASPAHCADATKIDWRSHYPHPVTVDYLSLDVDAASLLSLAKLPLDHIRFRVITIEHDAYRFGILPRRCMREILNAAKYDLICADVCATDGSPFEDWWVNPIEVDMAIADKFRCLGKKWTEILPPCTP